MNGHDYEYQVAEYLRKNGYTGVTVTQASGDFGIDVIAHKGGHKYAVQCKYYSNPVGIAAVQEAVAGMAYYKCDRAMVVTNSTFTKAAQDLARANNAELLSGVYGAYSARNTLFRKLPKKLKILLVGIYLFLASAIFVSTLQIIKDQSFWLAAYNVSATLIVILFPFWIVPVLRIIMHLLLSLVKIIIIKIKAAFVKTPSQTSAPVQARKVDENKVRSALMRIDSEFYSTDLSTLICEPHISTSIIQRRLKFGYTHAADLLDILEQQGLILRIDTSDYIWTEEAFQHSTAELKSFRD